MYKYVCVCVCTLLKPIPWVTKESTYNTTHAVLPVQQVGAMWTELAADEVHLFPTSVDETAIHDSHGMAHIIHPISFQFQTKLHLPSSSPSNSPTKSGINIKSGYYIFRLQLDTGTWITPPSTENI